MILYGIDNIRDLFGHKVMFLSLFCFARLVTALTWHHVSPWFGHEGAIGRSWAVASPFTRIPLSVLHCGFLSSGLINKSAQNQDVCLSLLFHDCPFPKSSISPRRAHPLPTPPMWYSTFISWPPPLPSPPLPSPPLLSPPLPSPFPPPFPFHPDCGGSAPAALVGLPFGCRHCDRVIASCWIVEGQHCVLNCER
jgi:hypothetical protein